MADDLDLDELHQAVNTLMSSPGGKPKKVAPRIPPAPVEDSSPPKVEGEKIVVKRPLPIISTGRPRGRTMDIIGPKPPAVAAPSARPKRQAPSLQPTSGWKAEEAELPKSVPEAPKVEEPADDLLASLNLKQESPPEPEQKTEWPDPLEVHGFKDEVDAPQPDEPSLEPDVPTKPASPVRLDPDDDRPQLALDTEEPNSPFVTTKVEKRPLGAYADAVPNASETAEAVEPPEPLKDSKPQTSDENILLQVQNAKDEDLTMQDLRQMSIPKQYESTEKSPSKDSRPVFDTNEYHRPIEATHAAHRTGSSFGWIFILAFAVVLVAALGFAYLVMTGGVDLSNLRF